ncbi:ATP-binding protein, partial [Eubacteriales bacterium OttesenSCG-928-A19]|nr:ATP-binding protein [Eubacteriales bacterium OttesenSCG-928-A19]
GLIMPNINRISISSDGTKNSLKKYKALGSISEYVWNGFDAQATEVCINIKQNALDSMLEQISIHDNGSGIARHLLELKFQPFYQSEKVYDPDIKHSETHGKNGVGRLTFFTFASDAIWETIYQKENKHFKYSIHINSNTLDVYHPSDEEERVVDETGTIVTFHNIFDPELSTNTIREYLAREFCWFLELNKRFQYRILINGTVLDYSNIIDSISEHEYRHQDSDTSFSVTCICWNEKLNEYSKYYYVKSDGKELAKEYTKLNKKGDGFHHSVYIQSFLFDNFNPTSSLTDAEQLSVFKTKTKNCDEFKFIMKEVNNLLFDMRRPFLKNHASTVIENLEIASAFPNYDPNNVLDTYRKSQIEIMVSCIYQAEPKVFSSLNKEQKKTFVRFLDLIMESGNVDSLFSIINEILDMSTVDRVELADILRFASLDNITKTIKLIKDRYKAVADLKDLVFRDDLNANEVNHVQKHIESHYWLFGEQYNLVTAAEPNFEEALRRHLSYLHKEYEDVSVLHPDRLKQMDIYAIRQNIRKDGFDNIVVELKHPDVSLGEVQLSQVKKYMDVVLNIDEFNASNMTWSFYLIGNKFNQNGYIEREIANKKADGEPSLVFSVDKYKIFVKTWSEVFAEFEMRHDHLNKKLELNRAAMISTATSANEIIAQQQKNTAAAPPLTYKSAKPRRKKKTSIK